MDPLLHEVLLILLAAGVTLLLMILGHRYDVPGLSAAVDAANGAA